MTEASNVNDDSKLEDDAKFALEKFEDLTRAWSPMLAVTFSCESLMMISAGFAYSKIDRHKVLNFDVELSTSYSEYRYYAISFMAVFLLCSVSFVIYICVLAEMTHVVVQNYGSNVR